MPVANASGYLNKVARYRALRGTAIKAQKRFEQALRCRSMDPRELRRLQKQIGECWTQCGRARMDLMHARHPETKRIGARV